MIFTRLIKHCAVLVLSVFLIAACSEQKATQSSSQAQAKLIDHSLWQATLDQYLVAGEDGDINRFHYELAKEQGAAELKQYIAKMESIKLAEYSLQEQKSYWINLYNALTANYVIDHYPVESITHLGATEGSFGPWDDKISTIESRQLSLNDIEHNILRKDWNDNRIHYAVNCASYGCPNLLATAFTSQNIESLLEQAASDYVNHSRGLTIKNDELYMSSIYEWYKVDFGHSNVGLIEHFKHYAKGDLKAFLQSYEGDLKHAYNWDLNEH